MRDMPKYLQNSRAIGRRYYDFHKICFTNCIESFKELMKQSRLRKNF